ncbi:hypothetical protein [uncultured Gammaproteobacteria bacterium]|nr:hypothetical protein [uncultured Gammaproteobacteria bacterium]
MKNINTESTKIDQASKAAIEKADYYAEVAKTATENADKDARAAEVAIAKADYYAEISKTATENADKDARAAEIAIANANETAQVAKRDGDAVAIAKADYYAEIAKDAIVKADASAEIAESAIANAKETAQVAKSATEDANESAQVAKSAVEDANEAAQAAKSAVEDANETAQFTDDADTDTAQIVDDTVVNVVNVVNVIDTVKTPEDSGTTYRLDEVTSTSDKGNNYNYFGKDTGKGINLTDVFISNDIDGILIVQYPEEAQYIGEPHANGLLESATLEKVSATLTTDLELAPVQFFESAPDANCCGNSHMDMDMNVQDLTIL